MGNSKGTKRAAKKVATKAGKKLAKKGTAKTVGRTLGKAASEILKVIDMINAIKDLSIEWQRQKTARKQIEAELKVQLKELKILKNYLDEVLEIWDRRQKESLKKMFKTLDEGLKNSNRRDCKSCSDISTFNSRTAKRL